MAWIISLCTYGALGTVCAFLYLHKSQRNYAVQLLWIFAFALFWPLLLPILPSDTQNSSPKTTKKRRKGPFFEEIEQTTFKMKEALEDTTEGTGWALTRESQLLRDVTEQLYILDQHIIELEELLSDPMLSEEKLQTQLEDEHSPSTQQSLNIQLKNIKQLKQLHRDKHELVHETLAMLHQVYSQVMLLRFTQCTHAAIEEALASLTQRLDSHNELHIELHA